MTRPRPASPSNCLTGISHKTHMKPKFFLILAVVALRSISAEAQPSPLGAATPIANVKFTDQRTLDIAKKLAEEYKVVMSISGILIGNDSLHLSFSVPQGILKDVLDILVIADPRFIWRQESDGAIAITVKGAPLSVLDVTLKSFDAENLERWDLVLRILKIPEVADWLTRNSCTMGEIVHFAGPSPRGGFRTQPANNWPIVVHARDVRLRSLLNEMAAKSKTYFWHAVQWDDRPCDINLTP